MRKLTVIICALLCFVLLQTPTDASTFREVKVVNSSSLVVKTAPTTTSATIATLTRGDFVTVLHTANNWATVHVDGKLGYVNTAFLATPTSTIKIASSKSGLVVKATPHASAKTVATLQYNMIVEDFGSVGNGWSFVQYGNVTGYVVSSFIGKPTTALKTTAFAVSLHNIASPSGVIKATLPTNTKVTVHSTIAGWAYVSTNTDRGYIEAAKLKNAFVIVIDPGHQQKGMSSHEPIGPGAKETKPKVSSGTTGVATRKPEYVLTLEAGLILQKQLVTQGYTVHMTRSTHNVSISNSERAKFANNKQADLVIRLHGDGSTNRNVRGLSVLVPHQNSPYTKAIFASSERAGKALLAAYKPHVVINGSGLFYRADLSGFNWSTVPVVLVEMGFMSNPTEDRLLSDTTYLTNLMHYTTNGINAYFNQ